MTYRVRRLIKVKIGSFEHRNIIRDIFWSDKIEGDVVSVEMCFLRRLNNTRERTRSSFGMSTLLTLLFFLRLHMAMRHFLKRLC